MATEKQLQKLEFIEKRINYAKSRKKDAAKELSRNHVGYEKAIKSIMIAGAWSTIVPIFTIGIIVLKFLIPHLMFHNWTFSSYEIPVLCLYIATCIITSVLGYKLWNLSATPVFTLVSLIIILICNLALFAGVLPLVIVVLDSIALVRFSTFCSWFRGIKI